jgi:hypothetical protein
MYDVSNVYILHGASKLLRDRHELSEINTLPTLSALHARPQSTMTKKKSKGSSTAPPSPDVVGQEAKAAATPNGKKSNTVKSSEAPVPTLVICRNK